MDDLVFVQLAIQLAAQGKGLVSPNPLVGSVVVKDGEIAGRGYHRYDDLKHAEVWALEEAGERARGATVYVNLEPCSHQGTGKRTPPCVKALIDAGVKRVVASMVDPNPQVNGRGFDQLRAAGIEVDVGVMEREARRLNEKFVKFVTTGLPFVHLKTACSLDGRIATRAGDSKWITGQEARAASQRLRHEYDAILVGIGTVLTDDPLLTDRTQLPRRRPLARIVLDSSLRIPLESQLVRTARDWPVIVFTAKREEARAGAFPTLAQSFVPWKTKLEALREFGVEVIRLEPDRGRLDLKTILSTLSGRNLSSVIVEGGAEAAGSFIAERLIDKATFFLAPKIIGGRDAVPAIGGEGIERLSGAIALGEVEVVRRGDDWEFTGYPMAKTVA
jgi:diaminohydroxyphosphoribosylaminopyrimidine deaminase/5-amino-6-(5-phosphoribosylamino)uracil reductase